MRDNRVVRPPEEEKTMATKPKSVCIIPGHGGVDSGAVYGNIVEKTAVLHMSLAMEAELKRHGIAVFMTRRTDVYVSPTDQAVVANRAGADLNVAVHLNAGGGDGVEAIHSYRNNGSKELGKAIVDAIATKLKQNKRPNYLFSRKIPGKMLDYHAVVRESKAPTVIIEGAFIDSKDRVIVDTVDEQKAMGVAIAHGVLNHLNVKILPVKPAPKKKAPVKKPATKRPTGWVYKRYLTKPGLNKKAIVTNCSAVNVRAKDSTSAKAVAIVMAKDTLEVTGLVTSSGWVEVYLPTPSVKK